MILGPSDLPICRYFRPSWLRTYVRNLTTDKGAGRDGQGLIEAVPGAGTECRGDREPIWQEAGGGLVLDGEARSGGAEPQQARREGRHRTRTTDRARRGRPDHRSDCRGRGPKQDDRAVLATQLRAEDQEQGRPALG